MGATTSNAVNRLLNGLGLHLMRRSTLDELISAGRNDRAGKIDGEVLQTDLNDEDLRQNEAAHNFRRTPRDGEPVEIVPLTYLKTLQRESLALRDQSSELAKLRRQLAAANRAFTAASAAQELAKPRFYTPTYDYWGLRTDPAVIHNHNFMRDPRFVLAYERGAVAEGYDPKYYWRTHVALWCGSVALALGGDFVECGVCRGMLSSSIMTYLDWNKIDRRFFLFDTFVGLDEALVTDEEVGTGNLAHFREMYKEDLYDNAVRNFSGFNNVEIVRGSVPSTLTSVNIGEVAYLSIDMNNTTPEIAAMDYFWDKLQPGAPILLDDYGFVNYEVQKRAFDAWAVQRKVEILALPTGQGLIIKPPVS